MASLFNFWGSTSFHWRGRSRAKLLSRILCTGHWNSTRKSWGDTMICTGRKGSCSANWGSWGSRSIQNQPKMNNTTRSWSNFRKFSANLSSCRGKFKLWSRTCSNNTRQPNYTKPRQINFKTTSTFSKITSNKPTYHSILQRPRK